MRVSVAKQDLGSRLEIPRRSLRTLGPYRSPQFWTRERGSNLVKGVYANLEIEGQTNETSTDKCLRRN